jgi:xanthine dehydrogenase iron-sulfur cluster and FAD-binding subunit A
MARSGASARSAPRSGGGARFALDGEIVRPGNISPQTTVLELLREHLGRTGTKKGCAEGDCAARTVVLAELSGARDLRWRPINACIGPLPTIDGKALVESHASQCDAPATSEAILLAVEESKARAVGPTAVAPSAALSP